MQQRTETRVGGARHWLLGAVLLMACSAEPALEPTGVGGTGQSMEPASAASDGGGSDGPMGGGSVATDGVPRTECEVLEVHARPREADMLLVLDRSLSMITEGRWDPSVAAVRTITSELEEKLRFGLMTFPGPEETQNCAGLPADQAAVCERSNGNSPDCRVGRIEVPIANTNAQAIASELDVTLPRGATPTSDSLEMARAVFAADAVQPDYVPNDKYVLLLTDGQPNCVFAVGETPGADASYAAVQALVQDGVPVYVVGYDTRGSEWAPVLDRMASLGGTGDTMHRRVEDEQSLLDELREIVGAAVSCSYELEAPPFDPTYVRVLVDGVQVDLDDPNGWQLVDEQAIRLEGTACEGLQDGNPHTVKVTVECVPII